MKHDAQVAVYHVRTILCHKSIGGLKFSVLASRAVVSIETWNTDRLVVLV